MTVLVKLDGIVGDVIHRKVDNEVIGFKLEETATNPNTGQSWTVYWTVWSSQVPNPGSLVEVKGELSLKGRVKNDANGNPVRSQINNEIAVAIDRNINAPEIKVLREAERPAVNNTTWPAAIPDESPF